MFVLVPLLFVGLALWIESGLPRPRPWAWAILAVACVLPAIVPIARFEYTAEFQSLALLPWQSIPTTGLALAACVAVFTAACGLVWATLRRESAGRAGCWRRGDGRRRRDRAPAHAERATNSATPISVGRATWVDAPSPPATCRRPVGRAPRAWGVPDPFYPWLMVTELFNASPGDVYRLGPATYYEDWLPTVPVEQRPDGSWSWSVADARQRTTC